MLLWKMSRHMWSQMTNVVMAWCLQAILCIVLHLAKRDFQWRVAVNNESAICNNIKSFRWIGKTKFFSHYKKKAIWKYCWHLDIGLGHSCLISICGEPMIQNWIRLTVSFNNRNISFMVWINIDINLLKLLYLKRPKVSFLLVDI